MFTRRGAAGSQIFYSIFFFYINIIFGFTHAEFINKQTIIFGCSFYDSHINLNANIATNVCTVS